MILYPQIKNQVVSWQSPSNIAIVKYWGKFGNQLPANPSLSFTLKNSVSNIIIKYNSKKDDKNISLNLSFEGSNNSKFESRIFKYLTSLTSIFSFLTQLHFEIEANNTFPHSAGIASSASGMSALALCLCSIEKRLSGTLQNADEFYKKASYVARLGSGSATRSIYGGFVSWGEIKELQGTSNEYGTHLSIDIHPVFKDYRDSILIVNSQQKKISSSEGHALMKDHPFAKSRTQQAKNNIKKLVSALKKGDEDSFISIAENEALSLHALMLSSNPSFLLLEPNTINIINKIQQYRKRNNKKLCFTIDAGPNIHLLYSAKIEKEINHFIKDELLVYCENNFFIEDEIGNGPKQIK